MDMVDDGSSRIEARLGKEETIWAAADVLQVWIGKYGVPGALYTDWKNVYKRKATPAEQLQGEGAGDAVRAHVSETGNSDHSRQFASGKGARDRKSTR